MTVPRCGFTGLSSGWPRLTGRYRSWRSLCASAIQRLRRSYVRDVERGNSTYRGVHNTDPTWGLNNPTPAIEVLILKVGYVDYHLARGF